MKNKNKRIYMTKKRKHKIFMRKTIIILFAIMLGVGIIGYNGQRTLETIESYQISKIELMNTVEAKTERIEPIKTVSKIVNQTTREVTAYNAGDSAQTDSTPCIGAGGDICKMLDQGKKICAANFVPMGTMLEVENYGICEVRDRMNSRYKNSVDIAMKVGEKKRALAFGRQTLIVKILKTK